jgi:hypothetical protein
MRARPEYSKLSAPAWILAAAGSVLIASLSGSAPAAAADDDDAFYEQAPRRLGRYRPGALLRWEVESELAPTLAGRTAFRILYRSTGALGDATAETGMVFLPAGSPPAGGWPVVAWGHGTSGVGDACAPSKYPAMWPGIWDRYADLIDKLLGEGYVVFASDYEGLGTRGPHTYLRLGPQGTAMIDGVAATRALVPETSAKWAAVGHSQGGQAALGAGEIATAARRGGQQFVGAVAFAPAHHLGDLVEPSATDKFWFPYIAYMAVGVRSTHPDFAYERFVGPLLQPLMPLAEEHCFDEWFYLDTRSLNPTPETALNPSWSEDPDIQEWLESTEPGLRPGGAAIVLQGTFDLLHLKHSELIAQMCASGTAVVDSIYPQVSHDHVIETGWEAARDWLRDRFAGRPAPSVCGGP